MQLTTLIAAMLIAQPQVPPVPQAPPVKEQPDAAPKAKEESYEQVAANAKRQGKAYAAFVGVARRALQDVESVSVATQYFSDYPAKCIIVSNKDGSWRATLPATATNDEIVNCEQQRTVQPTADPFDKSNRRLRRGEVRRTADDDRTDPQLRALLKDMEPYESAKNTQTTFRRWSGYITPSPRNALENKWQVPGHLDGVEGWSSKLYRRKGYKASEFLVRQDPSDGLSAVTWGRSYPDGSVFADVLRNADGSVFEVRTAEKNDGHWDRFIAYRNHGARPVGYVRPKSADCRSCHNQAGNSEYAGAAVPGGDSIISEGYAVLESGRVVQGGYGLSLGN